MLIVAEEGKVYYQGDILEEIQTGQVYVVSRADQTGLELLSGRLHPELGFFIQNQAPVTPVRTSFHPTGFRKIGIAPSFFPGAMALK